MASLGPAGGPVRAPGQGRELRHGCLDRGVDHRPDADPAVITGYKAARNRPLTRGQKLSNTALAAVRAPVEHGLAHLKNWRVLGKVRTDPTSTTALVKSLLVLTNREASR
ncbi:transposase family protein [Streptomyces sp. NBC_00076]|uniref:transposase family protein n=1 Tax=Streptomyces sp. NBC_00076 TaxID=2975642 RepID=UPI00324FC65A